MRCLVTGGCGFIGSALVCALLDKGWKVDTVDDLSGGDLSALDQIKKRVIHIDVLPIFEENHENERTKDQALVITGDFAHKNILNRIRGDRYDYIFHLAARPRVALSVEDPVTTSEINLFKTIAFFHACAGHTKRIVSSSSSSVFGNVHEFPTPETCEKKPLSPYALQKYCVEQFADLFCTLYELDIVNLRYFNVYGPGQYGDSPYATVISAWCYAVKNGHSLRLDGTGNQMRDFTYIDDVVNANILAAIGDDEVAGLTFNIGYGAPHSLNEILEFFKDKFAELHVCNAPPRVGDVFKTHANTSLATRLLGYKPQVGLFEGLQKTVTWWGVEDR